MSRSSPWRPRFKSFLGVLGLLGALAGARSATAQVRPDLDWRTLHTAHFRVHFNPELEPLARRTAANAEFAYERLAAELTPPRGIVDIVLADNVDYANGYATPFPMNRIVVYARPPIDAASLRNHVDWNLILVTHELAHVFHLDRTRGWWRVAQRVFGRAAPLFPNTYAPSWMVEGLAVHYETKIVGNGGGRLAGSEFPALVRAAALGGHLPELHELSLSAPRFPGGNVAYVFGAYAMTRADPRAVGEFVEASSARLIPWQFARSARKAFGEDFASYWKRWQDSVALATGRLQVPADPSKHRLTDHGFEARFPRWLDDSTLIYVAADARVSAGVYRLRDAATADDAHRERLARRNTVDANVPLGERRMVYADLEFRDPYTLYSDLYVDRGGLFGRRRLTHGERLTTPDVHEATGRIVAVQAVDGTTQLVTLTVGGDGVPVPLVRGTADARWSEPRWSHDGTRIAAARWERGGRASIVIMDATGRALREFAPRGLTLAIVSSPAWVRGDTTVLFVSDHEGRAMIYRGDVRTGAIARAWESATLLHTPDVSPDGRRIAAVELGAKGYDVVTRAMPSEGAFDASVEVAGADSAAAARDRWNQVLLVEPDTAARETRYHFFDQVRATWWLPTLENDNTGATRIGFITGGSDVLDRHDWDLEVGHQPGRTEWVFDGTYSYAGFGVPVVSVYAGQGWSHGAVNDVNDVRLGIYGQRVQYGGGFVQFERRRVRLSSYALLGGSVQQFTYRTYPRELLANLTNPVFRRRTTGQDAMAEVGFSTMQRPGLAVSAQDGVSASLRQRRIYGLGVQFEDTDETVATFVAAKSIPAPGYARHVLAVRGAYGIASHRTTAAFGVGGVSGTSIEIIPGVTYGDSRRTFFVRGFEGTAQVGVRAAAASAEYRMPLALSGRGLSYLPVFFQKSMLTFFGDAASAWCSFPVEDSFACGGPLREREVIASVGGELALDAALAYDDLYRFRLGVAHPVRGERYAERRTTVYVTIGSTF